MRTEEKKDKVKKILVIDDDPGIRGLIEEGLSMGRYKYEIKNDCDGREGLETIRDWVPDVIILDLHMPDKNGFEVIEEIRENREMKKTKVIMLTANPSRRNQYEGLDRGVNAFMAKPFDFIELEAMIRSLLD